MPSCLLYNKRTGISIAKCKKTRFFVYITYFRSNIMKKLRLALVGAGNIANVHLRAYANNPSVEVVAICDINEEHLNETADTFGIAARFTNVHDMLANTPDLDAADVCVWNCSHAECTIAALNAGLDVMCEKPMAMTTKEAEEMKAAADKNGKLLMLGFVTRFADDARIAKDFIDNGYLGDVYYSKAVYVRRHGNPGGWFSDKSKSGGGPLIDIGVHPLDLTRYLMGNPKPTSVYCVTANELHVDRANLKTRVNWYPKGADPKKDICDVESSAVAIVRYENGASTLLECSYNLHDGGEEKGGRTLYGTKGGINLDSMKFSTDVNGFMVDADILSKNFVDSKDMYQAEMDHFVDCCLNGTECKSPAEDGVVIMKILEGLYESAKTGKSVDID